MKNISYKAWAIKQPDGELTIGVHDTKRAAVTCLTGYETWNNPDRRNTLVALRRAGWKIVPVLVTEITGREADTK